MANWFDDNAPPGSTPSGSPVTPGNFGSLMQPVTPWTQTAPTVAPYQGPAPYQMQPFEGPQGTSDPSYQFRQQAALDAGQRSAAARGTLLTGGTQKALARNASDLASTEYAAEYARRLGLNQLQNQYGLIGNEQAYGRGLTANQQAQDRGQQAYQSGYQTFLNNQAAQMQNQQAQYNRLLGLTQLGAGAAQQTGEYGTQAGNAAAAGTIGGANAAMGGINTAMQLAQLYALNRNNGGGGSSGGGGYNPIAF